MTRSKPTRSVQLDLFSGDPAHGPREPARTQPAPIEPALVPDHVMGLVRSVPPRVRMGTSSWAYPGWDGLVYRGEFALSRLSREGLAAYARYPLFRTVGIDRTHYAPVETSVLAGMAAQVPDDFRFLAKAHEFCTLARFPEHARYGRNRGQENPMFLDAAYATDKVVAPFVDGLGAKGGPLLFQFAPQPMELFGGPERFAERLHAFLSALPRGPLYAVEVRNAPLLGRAYVQALVAAGVSHCINLHPGMPPPVQQWRFIRGAPMPALVIRWMLARGMTYERAEEAYTPFAAIVDRDDQAVQGIAQLIATAAGLDTYIIVNNKAEGSAPLSIVRLAEELARDDVPF